jgi:hypothetical protein
MILISVFATFLASSISHAETTVYTDIQSVISYYAFENKGTSSSETFNLRGADLDIPIQAPWFDWKCTAYRNIDGTSLACRKNEDTVDIKVFCKEADMYANRSMRVSKDSNFVTFEISCVKKKKPVVTNKKSTTKPASKSVKKENTQAQPLPDTEKPASNESIELKPLPPPQATTPTPAAPPAGSELPPPADFNPPPEMMNPPDTTAPAAPETKK